MISQQSTVVFIEGQDAAGLQLFVKRMNNYFRAEEEYAKIVSPERYETMPARKREHARKFAYSSPSRSKKEIDYWKLIRSFGLAFSFRSVGMTLSSPETRSFLTKLKNNTLPEGTNVPAELLQAHFDYDNLIQDLSSNHDLIVGERCAMSYYVDVIKGMNRPDILPAFTQFMNKIGQDRHPIWILRCKPETAAKRHLETTGVQLPVEHFEKIDQFYHDAANSGLWSSVSFIDTESEDTDDYRAIFASLAFQVNG